MKTVFRTSLTFMAMFMLSSFAMAEQNGADKPLPNVGDTVRIIEGKTVYLTGEKPSTWVYSRMHTVQQVGSKRFPNGILIKGIYSWIAPEFLEYNVPFLPTDTVVNEQVVENIEAKPVEPTDTVAGGSKQHVKAEEPIFIPQDTLPSKPLQELETPQGGYVYEYPEETNKKPVAHAIYNRLSEYDRFTIGLRGGAASLMHQTDAMGNWRTGFDGLLDLQYAHYFGKRKWDSKVNLGVITGLSIGWAQSGLRSAVDTTYTVGTSDGNIDYTVSAENVQENDGQLQLEIPIMFSLITEKGFFFNVGPKLVVPVYTHYKQNISNPDINAYFQEEGVNVSNEVITGLVQDNQMKTKGKWNSSKINVMLTAELGYEWLLNNGHSIGLGAYANYSVYNLYKNNTDNKSLINVSAPSASAPADVNVFSATDTYANGLGYFDCGLKFTYNFNFYK
ncbi:MAG: hypothetical protein NC038_04215 [Paludibacter sp.]|nr:hypothetical protein [Bacteroidales bacterium]MCM1069427.1 hypothetical protein [Prevotella sp.]MCM1353802.1 hypothetical protein [Bacteroides sp.]MCM1442797.1 hypothetical protein [Muribaculum sp.]MCM1481837.1 hypothetical protein [Paludibacter sp.]